ncbi:MAG: dTDP-4-dehydrorhamnose 3,5-epimerase [Acidimicrobiia bacterium]|nr:dTDP-4-dehydrorhamnose 3,5-epimerase [Acidimicrobiia bacterium]
MKVTETGLPGVLVLEPTVHGDDRGFFYESWNAQAFAEATGIETDFVQDNHSRSAPGVLRGLHYQLPPHAQGKLLRVVVGAVYDVAVDIRRSSPTFGRWAGVELSAHNRLQLWVPPGFAHGFVALTDAELLYKTTAFYHASSDRSIRWDDVDIAIVWPLAGNLTDGAAPQPQLSAKDRRAPFLADADVFD